MASRGQNPPAGSVMVRKELVKQWLGAVTTAQRDRWPAPILSPGDHIWNTDVNCWQVWNGFVWVSICPGAGGGKSEPEIIVGNAPAGDTPAVCDILDPGDGTGIALAFLLAPAGGAHIYIRRGTYTLIATQNVPANVDVQGAGHGSFIRAPAGQVAFIVTGSNTRVRGFRIEGIRVNPTLSFITIEDCNVTNSPVDGIQIRTGCSYIAIHKNIVQGNTVNGIDIQGSDYCSLKSNNVLSNGNHGIYLRNTTTRSKIEDQTIRNNAGQGIMIGAVVDADSIIIDCIFQGNVAPQLTNNSPNTTETIHNRFL